MHADCICPCRPRFSSPRSLRKSAMSSKEPPESFRYDSTAWRSAAYTHTYLFRSPLNSPWPFSPPHSHDLLLSSLANSLPLQRLTTYTTRIIHQAAVAGGFAATVMFPIGTPAGERGGLHSKESERERDTDRERDTVMQVRKKTGILICNATVRDSEREARVRARERRREV